MAAEITRTKLSESNRAVPSSMCTKNPLMKDAANSAQQALMLSIGKDLPLMKRQSAGNVATKMTASIIKISIWITKPIVIATYSVSSKTEHVLDRKMQQLARLDCKVNRPGLVDKG